MSILSEKWVSLAGELNETNPILSDTTDAKSPDITKRDMSLSPLGTKKTKFTSSQSVFYRIGLLSDISDRPMYNLSYYWKVAPDTFFKYIEEGTQPHGIDFTKSPNKTQNDPISFCVYFKVGISLRCQMHQFITIGRYEWNDIPFNNSNREKFSKFVELLNKEYGEPIDSLGSLDY